MRLPFLFGSSPLLALPMMAALYSYPVNSFTCTGPSISSNRQPYRSVLNAVQVESDSNTNITTTTNNNKQGTKDGNPNYENRQYWQICPSPRYPHGRPLPPALQRALETNTHPVESPSELGCGTSITCDWRDNWSTYESHVDDLEGLVCRPTGMAEYDLDDIEGSLPPDLRGVLFRNGPGKLGVGGERVQHTLDADALIYKISFPGSNDDGGGVLPHFQSRFVETKHFRSEQQAGRFLYRGTFGTGPTDPFWDRTRPKNGLNRDPVPPSLLSKVLGRAGKVDIKNTANTQIVSFGGKLLALFEAGLPHSLDPKTLETLGEDTLGGMLEEGLPVKLPKGVPGPDFLGGSAHTAHPNVCPTTGHLVGWHWSAMVAENSNLQLTFTEYSPDKFQVVASKTYPVPGCALAPHDMAITDDHIIINVNAMTMNQLPFLLGLQGPAESLSMDGRAKIQTWVFPRPTAKDPMEPLQVETPPCFCIHHSHAYQDEETGHLVTYFTGWPPSDSKDFLGAWGGHSPEFQRIPATFLWRQEIDLQAKKVVSLDVAPGCANVCVEHVLVHPNFATRAAQYVYGTVSNVVGDSTPPNGYARLRVLEGSNEPLQEGEYNREVEAYWFGTRYFTTEPLIVPKEGGNLENEREAYLVGVVRDAVAGRNFVAIFDLEKNLQEGPVCKVWLKSGVPHGIHGCFAQDDKGGPSVFC